jgi:hypothetical protein
MNTTIAKMFAIKAAKIAGRRPTSSDSDPTVSKARRRLKT